MWASLNFRLSFNDRFSTRNFKTLLESSSFSSSFAVLSEKQLKEPYKDSVLLIAVTNVCLTKLLLPNKKTLSFTKSFVGKLLLLYSAILSSIFSLVGKKSYELKLFDASSSPFSIFNKFFVGFNISLIDVFAFGNENLNPSTV